MMISRATLALLAASAAGCVLTEPDRQDLGQRESTIIGGTRSLGTEATVMLVGYPPDRSVLHSCTAVVISPTVLLTAAHCVDAATHPSYLYGVYTGDDASAYPTLVDLEPQLKAVSAVHTHPQYNPNLPFYGDIAVVMMTAPLPITPAPIQREPLDTTIVGKAARIVGYGQTTYGTFQQARYEAMTTVSAVENDTIVVGDTTHRSCLGDSGGPAFVGGTVVGIDSYGPVGCDAPAHYRRPDSFLPFIDQYVPPSDPGTGSGSGSGSGSDMLPGDTTDGGGCSTGSHGSPAVALALLGLALGRRRRARA